MTDIFDEVEEDVRKERYEQLWKKYGNYFVAVAVVVVLAVGGYRGWQYYQHRENEKASDAFMTAQTLAQSGQLVQAEGAYAELAKSAPAGYATLAKFMQAAVLLSESKREAALVILRELMTTDDEVLANVARLQVAWVEADSAPKDRLRTTLEPLLAPDNPFRFSASEVLAYASLRLGDRNEAIALWDKIAKDPAAPKGVSQRAAAIAEYLKANPDVTTLPLAAAPPTLPTAPAHGAPLTVPAPASPAPASSAPAPAQEAPHP